MSSGQITENTETQFYVVDGTPVHLALGGSFDSASLALEQTINETIYPVLDVDGNPIIYTHAVNDVLNFNRRDRIRLNPTGGGAAMAVDFSFAGTSPSDPTMKR